MKENIHDVEYSAELTNQFVDFKIATRLKELGFEEPCLGAYYDATEYFSLLDNNKGYHRRDMVAPGYANRTKTTLAPLWQQVKDWLREEHQMSVETYQADSGDYVYAINGTGRTHPRIAQDGNFSYPIALRLGIQEALKRIK